MFSGLMTKASKVEGGLDTNQAYGLKDSIIEEAVNLDDDEMVHMVEKWAFIEDDPEVLEAEIEEAIEELEQEQEQASQDGSDGEGGDDDDGDDDDGDDDDDGASAAIQPTISCLQAWEHLQQLQQLGTSMNLSSGDIGLLHRFERRLREKQLSRPTSAVTLHNYFQTKDKTKDKNSQN